MSEKAPNTNTFKFFHNAETRLYIEGVKEKEESIFSDVYRAFFTELNDKLPDIRRDKFDKSDAELRNNLNNIFAFVGDRGSGKTSCMLSVAKMLEENEKKPVPEFEKNKMEFCVLETIDPSFFDEYTNILDIVLGRMFRDFRKKWEDGDQDCINERDQLLESFEIVKRTISQMNAKKNKDESFLSEEDNVERLINLSASVSLKCDIYKLIQTYLKFFDKKILVVPIDDVDLHSQCAYEMVEQVRKYLIQYNVIVLMALKIEQLDKVVEKTYLKNFSEMLPKKLLSIDQIADMANKYLIKLIPDSQRFVLPSIDVMYNKIVAIYEKAEKSTEDDLEFLNQKWNRNVVNSGYPARYIVLKLIFDKTRYLFYHMQGSTSLIVPHTLREYNQLIEMLLNMDDYDKIEQINNKQRNKNTFRNYFVNSWCRSNLENKDSDFIKNLFSIADPSIINKTVVQKLYDRFPSLKNAELNEISKVVDEKNKTYNISVGDVNLFLRWIKGTLIDFKENAFVFAIETFYSMRLYEYYDLRTEAELYRKEEKIEKNVLVRNNIDDYSPYEILIGGSVFNLRSGDGLVIPKNAEENRRRDRRLISLKTIRTSLENLLLKDELNEKEKKEFKLIELFALLTFRRKYDSDDEDGVPASDYRAKDDVVYASEFPPNQRTIWYDVLSFFSNLENVERCYNRVDKDFYKKAEEMDDSLYNRIIKCCSDHRSHVQNSKQHALYSYCSIRNMEILNSFFNDLRRNFEKRKFPADNRESLIEFFKGVQGYSIKTYKEKNENDEKEWHQIDFGFVYEFIEVLKDDEIKELFDEIFLGKNIENSKKTDKSTSGFSALRVASEKLEKNAIKKIETSGLFEDIYKCFDKGRMYPSLEVREIIRTVLRTNVDQKMAYNKLSRWISANVRDYHQLWSNPEIENLIEKFIHYIHSLKEKMK